MHRSMCSGSSCYLCSIHLGNSGIIVYGMFYNLIQLYMDNVSNDLNTKQGRNAYLLDYFINGQDSSTYLTDKQSCTPLKPVLRLWCRQKSVANQLLLHSIQCSFSLHQCKYLTDFNYLYFLISWEYSCFSCFCINAFSLSREFILQQLLCNYSD